MGSVLARIHLWGMVSDLATPSMMGGSFEVLGDDGALVLDALVGPQGIPGENSPIVDMQWSSITDPEDLPTNLTDDELDIGKAWWIGNQVYVWTGDAVAHLRHGHPGSAWAGAQHQPDGGAGRSRRPRRGQRGHRHGHRHLPRMALQDQGSAWSEG